MYTLHNVGDQALLVEFENEISMEVNRKVMALKGALEAHRLPGIGGTGPHIPLPGHPLRPSHS